MDIWKGSERKITHEYFRTAALSHYLLNSVFVCWSRMTQNSWYKDSFVISDDRVCCVWCSELTGKINKTLSLYWQIISPTGGACASKVNTVQSFNLDIVNNQMNDTSLKTWIGTLLPSRKYFKYQFILSVGLSWLTLRIEVTQIVNQMFLVVKHDMRS